MDYETKMYRIFLILIPIIIIAWNLIGSLIFKYSWTLLAQISIYLLIILYSILMIFINWPKREIKKEKRNIILSIVFIVLSVLLSLNLLI